MAQAMMSSPMAEKQTSTRARGWAVARTAWIGLVIFNLFMFATNIGPTFALLEKPCPWPDGANCPAGQLALADWRSMQASGITPTMYAAFALGVILAASLISFAVGFLIVWRKWGDLMGLFVSAILITFGSTGISDTLTATRDGPYVLGIAQFFIVALSYPALAIFLLTFPTGKFTPRWTAFIVVLWSIQFGFFNFGPTAILPFSILSTWGSCIAVQVYRYRKVYTPVQRQQTRWVVFSLVVAISSLLILNLAPILLPELNTPGSFFRLAEVLGLALFWSPISLGVGIAILRSRLYDIDMLINRVLVYGLLTAILAGLYAGGVIGGQRLLTLVTSSQVASDSPLTIVVTTLLMASLFYPLRRWLQTLIDRRFYRRKYDAARTVASFSASLRSEVNLSDLSDNLLATVDEAMQPAHVSLWLSPRAERATVERNAQRGVEA